MMCVPRMFYIHFNAFITHVFIVTVCVCFYCCWHCWWLRECAARRRCWLMKFYCHHASAGLRCVVSWCHAFLRMSLFLANRTKPNSFENISVRIFSTDSNSKTVWNLCPGILLLVPISMNVNKINVSPTRYAYIFVPLESGSKRANVRSVAFAFHVTI